MNVVFIDYVYIDIYYNTTYYLRIDVYTRILCNSNVTPSDAEFVSCSALLSVLFLTLLFM
jgi:hypothetical protein